MTQIILNKIRIFPNASDTDEYEKQIRSVSRFCQGIEDGIFKALCFSKIVPIPNGFKKESKEEDDWILKHWGARSKASNCQWLYEDEIKFETITYPAIPIFEKIVEKFPNIDFNYTFSNKTIGITTGELISLNGKIATARIYKDLSKEAFQTTFILNPQIKKQYSYDNEKNTFYRNTLAIRQIINENGFFKDIDGTVIIGCDDKQKPLFDNLSELPF